MKEVREVLSHVGLGKGLRDDHLRFERTPPFSRGVDDPVLADTMKDESSPKDVEPQTGGSPCRLTVYEFSGHTRANARVWSAATRG